MADSKITALTALTAADPANDMIPIVDVSDTPPASGNTKRISINNILACSPTATLASATITGDLTVDTSTLYVSSSADKVGIGTTSLSNEKLTVAGNISANAWLGRANISAPAGDCSIFRSADNTLAFGIASSTAMTLNSTGLGVGVVPSTKLHIGGTGSQVLRVQTSTSGDPSLNLLASGVNDAVIAYDRTNNYLRFDVSAVIGAFILGPTGNVGVGVTPSYRLTVQGADNSVIAQFGGSNRQVRLSTSAISAVDNASFNFIHTSGSGRFTFQNNSGTQTMLTIDDNGNNILRMPATPPTLGVNLEGTFNLTSNTNLRISVRGSDGVTRTANITLA